MRKSIFMVLLLVTAATLSACGGDSTDDVNAAIAAGESMNQTAQACVTYAETHDGDMRVLECSGIEPRQEYLRAKAKLKQPNPAFEQIDAANMQLGMEVVAMVAKKPGAVAQPQKQTTKGKP